ncbi:hypothetical protein AX15_004279 [Amanita polypyramis BW_CC]|nr:hypothetical protein AX15_004279 [Amanita polypyramis BW_CC]
MHSSIWLVDPHCHAMQELSSASTERATVRVLLERCANRDGEAEREIATSTLYQHLSYGLAYTAGSALGCTPPSTDKCLEAFLVLNKVGLTTGARAWSKHFRRSMPPDVQDGEGADSEMGSKKQKKAAGWWGIASGPVATINAKALVLFWRVMNGATWRNLHWLPHEVLVYEVRVAEGYGMRWSQDRSASVVGTEEERPWMFRGFVEPMMENGHEVGWRR